MTNIRNVLEWPGSSRKSSVFDVKNGFFQVELHSA